MILYRPVGLQELALIYDSGMTAFPARLPQQPIFYPVLDLEYARQTASGWNARNGEFAGYVTQFKVEDEYIGKYEEHTVGESQHQELWIPAEDVEEFNRHIVGHIRVVEAHFGDAFQGFVPERFALQGKSAAEQFTVLANSYLYKRMDFYLEIKRNHKAVFLNYPFWQAYEFKNPGMKEKVLQAIKEAWLTSFPKIPLPVPSPILQNPPAAEQIPSRARRLVGLRREEFPRDERVEPDSKADPIEEILFEEGSDSGSFESAMQQTPSYPRRDTIPARDELTPVEETVPAAWAEASDEEPGPEETIPSSELTPAGGTDSHLVRGIRLGLHGKYREAVGALFRAVGENPDDVIAQTSLGVAFHRLGEDDRALACYENALKIDPIYAEAHYFRSNILYRSGHVREAIAGYTIAMGLHPQLIEAHRNPHPPDRLTDYTGVPAEMARIAKPTHRILELTNALDSSPGQPNLWKERAAQYYRLRNYAQAIADYSAALAIQPEDASALRSRGVAYEQLGQFERAQDDFREASALHPQYADEYINRGIAFAQHGNLRQAIASLTESIRLAPANPDAYFNRGIVYSQQGDFKNAIEDLSQVIRLAPRDEGAYYWRGLFHEEAGQQREAMADYRQFLMLSQDARARAEVEQKMRQWHATKQAQRSSRAVSQRDVQEPEPPPAEERGPEFDLHSLLVALGGRALKSLWFGSNVQCYGAKAEELYAAARQQRPLDGRDLLHVTSGIQRTIKGDFQAFDPGADSPWIFIRAWDGNGFYVETNDPKSKDRLLSRFPSVEQVDGATPPFQGLLIRL